MNRSRSARSGFRDEATHRVAERGPARGARGFSPNRIVTFLSDFGTQDTYVAQVKAAIWTLAAEVRIVDATHEVSPQDVRSAAFHLSCLARVFPRGTVHLAVVDPGVGTARRAAVVEARGHVFVGPDNGLLSWAAGRNAVWRECTLDGVPGWPMRSRTFHGRDLFGPVAALLAAGRMRPQDCGPILDDPVRLARRAARHGPRTACGEVLAVDRFGNLIVDIQGAWLRRRTRDGDRVLLAAGGVEVEAVVGPYGAGGDILVHEDSSGWTEVAVPRGRADAVLKAAGGSLVTVRLLGCETAS